MEIIARSCRDIVRCPVIFPTALQPDGAAGFTRPVGARFKKCEEKADSHNLLRRNMPLRPDGTAEFTQYSFPLARWQESRQRCLGVRACWYLCMIELIYNYSFVHKDKSITFFTVFEIFHCFPYYDNT